MRNILVALSICCLLLCCCTAGRAASTLDKFEDDVAGTEQHHDDNTNKDHDDQRDDHADDHDDNQPVVVVSPNYDYTPSSCGGGDVSLGDFFLAFDQLGVNSQWRVAPTAASRKIIPPRRLGDPLLPYARVDLTYRSVEQDISARDLRVEVGYGPIGVQVSDSHYQESNPTDSLTIQEIFGLYRMSPNAQCEVDLGAGTLTLDGDRTTTKPALTVPLLYQATSHWAVELRPAWADRCTDIDAAVLYSVHAVSLKAGYRWIESTHTSLNGPYVGMSVRL